MAACSRPASTLSIARPNGAQSPTAFDVSSLCQRTRRNPIATRSSANRRLCQVTRSRSLHRSSVRIGDRRVIVAPACTDQQCTCSRERKRPPSVRSLRRCHALAASNRIVIVPRIDRRPRDVRYRVGTCISAECLSRLCRAIDAVYGRTTAFAASAAILRTQATPSMRCCLPRLRRCGLGQAVRSKLSRSL